MYTTDFPCASAAVSRFTRDFQHPPPLRSATSDRSSRAYAERGTFLSTRPPMRGSGQVIKYQCRGAKRGEHSFFLFSLYSRERERETGIKFYKEKLNVDWWTMKRSNYVGCISAPKKCNLCGNSCYTEKDSVESNRALVWVSKVLIDVRKRFDFNSILLVASSSQ